MVYADNDQRRRVIAGLRSLVALLEARPELPVPAYTDFLVFPPQREDEARCAEVDRVAALLGSEVDTESFDHGHYRTGRSFGPVRYQLTAILSPARARYDAWRSYADSVTPDDASKEM